MPVNEFSFFMGYQDFGNQAANKRKQECLDCLQKIYPHINIYDGEVTGPAKMFCRNRINVYAYARRHLRGNLVFLETDIVAKRPIPDIWNETFDIGLTEGNVTSKYNLQPFNAGMIFSKDTPGAHHFFDYINQVCNDTMESVYVHSWHVDQLAMGNAWNTQKAMVNFKVFEKEYNYFPVDENDVGHAYFMHFKGEDRKNFMKLHADKVINASA